MLLLFLKYFLRYGDLIAESIALVVGFMSFGYLNKYLRTIFLQVIIATIVESLGYYFRARISINSLIYNIYVIIDMWLLGVTGLLMLNKTKAVVMNYAILFCLTIVILIWDRKNISDFNNNSFLIVCVFITFIFLKVLIRIFASNITSSAIDIRLIISLTIILYYGCNIPHFIFIKLLSREKAYLLYNITHILNMVMYLAFSYCFVQCRKQALLLKRTAT